MTTFQTTVSLPEETRRELVELLNRLLANSMDLYFQAKHAHWNVKGKHFLSRHELFDKVAEHAQEHSDLMAERIAQLGGYARGTLRMAADSTQLDEFDPSAISGEACVRILVDRLSQLNGQVRDAVQRCGELNEPITQDLLIEVVRALEMDGWFLVNHLERLDALVEGVGVGEPGVNASPPA